MSKTKNVSRETAFKKGDLVEWRAPGETTPGRARVVRVLDRDALLIKRLARDCERESNYKDLLAEASLAELRLAREAVETQPATKAKIARLTAAIKRQEKTDGETT